MLIEKLQEQSYIEIAQLNHTVYAFNPVIAEPGFHTLTYHYTTNDDTACETEVSSTILVGTVTYNFVSYGLGTIAP